MQEQAMVELWKFYNESLTESLQLSRRNAEAITRMKTQSLLASMRPIKILGILVGFLWIIMIDSLIIKLFPVATAFFLASAIIQVVLTKLAIGIYLYQLVLIHQADLSEPVLAAQERIARLRSSTLWVAKLSFLQLPVWTTFYWNSTMLTYGNTVLFIVQGSVTVTFIVAAIWLFINIRYENRNKRWFRLLFSGKEWTPTIKAMELLQEIDEYRKPGLK